MPATWGGRRRAAGRRARTGRRDVPHRRRPLHDPRCPAHVTLRTAPSVPSLRLETLFIATRTALARSSTGAFRVLHFSVQRDHVHLLIEADQPWTYVRGLQGLAIRVAKAVNRVLGRRGRFWGDRYHARALRTPREVRNALVYVLNNFRKHVRDACGLDARSSGRWFDGWRRPLERPPQRSPVAMPRTWLARIGWRRRGLIDLDEHPRLH